MKNTFLVLSFMILTLVLTGCGNKVKLEDYVYLKGNDVKLEDYQLENEGFKLALDKEKLEKDHPDFIQQIKENYELEDLDSLILVNDYALSNFNYTIEDVENKNPIVITFKEDFDYQSLNLDQSIKVNLKNKQTKNEIKSYNEKIEGFNSELEKIEDAYLPLFNDLKELFAEYDLKIQAVTGAFLHDEKFGETYTLTDEDKLYDFKENPMFVVTKKVGEEKYTGYLNKDFYTIVNKVNFKGVFPIRIGETKENENGLSQRVIESVTDPIDSVYFDSVKYQSMFVLNGQTYEDSDHMDEVIKNNEAKYEEKKTYDSNESKSYPKPVETIKGLSSDFFPDLFEYEDIIPETGMKTKKELKGPSSNILVSDYVHSQINNQEYSSFSFLVFDLIFNNYNMSFKTKDLV